MITRNAKKFNLDEVFFPVVEQPVRWFGNDGVGKSIPGYKAIVDRNTGRTLSVVSSKYRLVTNYEAFRVADYVVREVFEGKALSDFDCYNVLMPQSKGSCRIDLIIPNNFNKLFGNDKESWIPFVRISNSYNRTTTLKYEIGFCRWICLNGVIFGKMGINFSVTHTDGITDKEIAKLKTNARSHIGSIGSLWAAFEQKMEMLKSIELPLSSALAMFCKAFEIVVDKGRATPAQIDGYSLRAKQIMEASKDYFRDLGSNAYAMMNVLTDFASFPEWTNHPANFVDGYQHRVGRWVDNFIEEQNKPGFNLSQYIGAEYQSTADYMETLLQGLQSTFFLTK